jgi:hypothetical protein
VSARRLTSALTSVVQQMGMSQSGFGPSLFFMSTIQKEVTSLDDWTASGPSWECFYCRRLPLMIAKKGCIPVVGVFGQE